MDIARSHCDSTAFMFSVCHKVEQWLALKPSTCDKSSQVYCFNSRIQKTAKLYNTKLCNEIHIIKLCTVKTFVLYFRPFYRSAESGYTIYGKFLSVRPSVCLSTTIAWFGIFRNTPYKHWRRIFATCISCGKKHRSACSTRQEDQPEILRIIEVG